MQAHQASSTKGGSPRYAGQGAPGPYPPTRRPGWRSSLGISSRAVQLGLTELVEESPPLLPTRGVTAPATVRRHTGFLEVPVSQVVDYENVSAAGLESSPVADALAGLRA